MNTMNTTMTPTVTNIHGLDDETLGRAIVAKSLGLLWLQDAKAMNESGTSCVMRTEDGLRCAVGHLLPASADLDRVTTAWAMCINSSHADPLTRELDGVLFQGGTAPAWVRDLLINLQGLHDGAPSGEMRYHLMVASPRTPCPPLDAWRQTMATLGADQRRLMAMAMASIGHMVIQGHAATATVGGTCTYLADNGDTCAVGCLMLDTVREPSLRGMAVLQGADLRDAAWLPESARELLHALQASSLDTSPVGIELLGMLQMVHDGGCDMAPLYLGRRLVAAAGMPLTRPKVREDIDQAQACVRAASVLRTATEMVLHTHMPAILS